MSGLVDGYGRVEYLLHEVGILYVYIDRKTVGGFGVGAGLEFGTYQFSYGGKGIGTGLGY